MLPPTDNFLRMALPALVLGVLLAVCCYFGNVGNALLCESYHFSTTNYKPEAVLQNDVPPFARLGQKVGGCATTRPPPPPAPKPMQFITFYSENF